MSVSLVVPYSPATEERAAHWRWLLALYHRRLPDWEVSVSAGPTGVWNKGAAANMAAERAGGDVLVVIDADCWVACSVLEQAAELVAGGEAPWVVPHDLVYRLKQTATQALLAGQLAGPPHALERHRTARKPYHCPAGGGCVVVPRAAFLEAGGIDPRFEGWGGEDISLGWALDTLVGTHQRLGAALWHLWHPPQDRRYRPRNERLAGRYREANGDQPMMRRLVDGMADGDEWRQLVRERKVRDREAQRASERARAAC